MSLAVGTRLGSYDLQSCLGGTGMGEVWNGYDPKLQRLPHRVGEWLGS